MALAVLIFYFTKDIAWHSTYMVIIEQDSMALKGTFLWIQK